MRPHAIFGKCVLAGVVALAAVASTVTAHAGVTVLYAFKSGADGCSPFRAGVIEDKQGNLYGTTETNGVNGYCNGPGTVFKIAPDGSETILHIFAGQRGGDGSFPIGGLIMDEAGNLYGTTYQGGTYGYGTVFKVGPDGTETVLYSFAGQDDGSKPYGGLIMDEAGDLYGTTTGGGTSRYGTVFKIAPNGTETVLHDFTGSQDGDGAGPEGSLILDEAGNLYGTTADGGWEGCMNQYNTGCGSVFKLAPDGTETVLYAFAGGRDGAIPEAGLTRDKAGNLYGTTSEGGGHGCQPYIGCGTVFRLAPDGTETVLYAFKGGKDGGVPFGGVIRDKAGYLYGTTMGGGGAGDFRACEDNPHGCGTVFKLAPDGTELVLLTFGNHKHDGIGPSAGLMKGADGELYGTASAGGILTDCGGGCGTVFRLNK